MSDRDAIHTLTELQEARAEIDRLRKINQGQFEAAFNLIKRIEELHDLGRWRDAYGEPPTEEGIYLVINNDFDGGTSVHATYWKGRWPIEFTVANWRPIGPLPGGE